MAELWDRHQIADYLGIKADSVNSWLVRHGVPVAGHRPAGRGALANTYRATDIRAARASSPGRGHRSDLEGR